MRKKMDSGIKLNYLIELTDDMGLLQFGKYSIPDKKSGYTTDDNARALIAALKHYNLFTDKASVLLSKTYLSFLHYMQRDDGKFHNLVDYRRNFLDEEGSEDSQGRALWSCGYTLNSKIHQNFKKLAKEIFEKAIVRSFDYKSLRARAYAIFGLYFYYKELGAADILDKMIDLIQPLKRGYENESKKSQEWKWFEPYLVYDNAILSEAFFYIYDITGEKEYLQIGLETLGFLTKLLFIDNKLVVIGQKEWYHKDGNRSLYDQQPIDAAAMVDLYIVAYKITKDTEFWNKAIFSFEWFLGRNVQNVSLYDEGIYGCFDGLTAEGLNLNQGAESTISYLLARLGIEEINRSGKFKKYQFSSFKNTTK